MSKLNTKQLAWRMEVARWPRTLRQFADMIGISSATLSRIENGKAPDIETYHKICEYLGVPMEEFFKEAITCFPCSNSTVPQHVKK